LPDVNVWLSLCYDRHEHHRHAVNWLETVRIPVYFCRVTQMFLLRLLTNPRVMGSDILTPQDAIGLYRDLRSDERVRYTHEPGNIQELWYSLMSVSSANGSLWTDAWLAAFALAHGSKLVSFDVGMRRWASLRPEILSHSSTPGPT